MKQYAFTFCLAVGALVASATEVHVNNLYGSPIRFENESVRLVCPVGPSVFEWEDSATVNVGFADTDLHETILTDSGITDITVTMNADASASVITVAGRQGWLEFFGEGFGLGCLIFGYAFTIRIFKKIGKNNTEI